MINSMDSSNVDFFSDKEKAVAEILVDLPGLVSARERRQFHKVIWKSKRNRSVLEDFHTTTTSSSPVSEESKSKSKMKKNVDMAAAAAANSPLTTLEFHSSESEECKQSNSKKRLSFRHETEKNGKLGMNGGFIEPHYQYQICRDPYGQRTLMGRPPPHHSGLGLVNGTGFLHSSLPLDLNRLLMRLNAAEARRRRMMKIKEAKNKRTSQSQHFNAH